MIKYWNMVIKFCPEQVKSNLNFTMAAVIVSCALCCLLLLLIIYASFHARSSQKQCESGDLLCWSCLRSAFEGNNGRVDQISISISYKMRWNRWLWFNGLDVAERFIVNNMDHKSITNLHNAFLSTWVSAMRYRAHLSQEPLKLYGQLRLNVVRSTAQTTQMWPPHCFGQHSIRRNCWWTNKTTNINMKAKSWSGNMRYETMNWCVSMGIREQLISLFIVRWMGRGKWGIYCNSHMI